MTVLPSRPSIFLKLLVFWPVSAPTHFVSLSQIPLSLRRPAHTAPGLSAMLEWPSGPVLTQSTLLHCLYLFISGHTGPALLHSGFLS